MIDWYEERHKLQPDQIFKLHDGSIVKLDRTVPGDGTKWYVADWYRGWSYQDSTIEPGEIEDMTTEPQVCLSCNGSGYYDHNGSPPCGACNGKGWT